MFFVVDPKHENYQLVKKIRTSGVKPAYVGEFSITDYPISEDDILSEGPLAWDSSLSTISDYVQYALAHSSNFVNTPAQEELLIRMLKKPVLDPAQSERLWQEQVFSLLGQYRMSE